MPEKDPTKSIREEFPSVSPGANHDVENRVGRRFHPEKLGDRPFKLNPDVYIDYVVDDRKKEEISASPLNYLGKYTLKYIDQSREFGMSIEDNPPAKDMIENDKNRLLSRLREERWQKEYSDLVAARINDEARSMGYVADSNLDSILQADQFISGLDYLDFEKFLRNHITAEHKRNENLEKIYKEYQRKFITKITSAAVEGLLPADLDIKRAERRIRNTRLIGIDLLGYEGAEGSYFKGAHDIYIVNLASLDGQLEPLSPHFLSKEYQEQILTHEDLHAISGMGVLYNTLEVSEDIEPDLLDFHRVFKIGLSFSFGVAKKGKLGLGQSSRFEWLNEAVTEKTTIKIEDVDDSDSYKKARLLYELIRQKGSKELPENLFMEAYFEDYNPNAPAGKRLPKWSKLRRVINDAYDRRFLIELDDLILAYDLLGMDTGIDKAIEFMEKLGEGGYGTSQKTLQEKRSEKVLSLRLGSKTSWKDIVLTEMGLNLDANRHDIWEASQKINNDSNP
jgi:hypothetical protein